MSVIDEGAQQDHLPPRVPDELCVGSLEHGLEQSLRHGITISQLAAIVILSVWLIVLVVFAVGALWDGLFLVSWTGDGFSKLPDWLQMGLHMLAPRYMQLPPVPVVN